MKFKRIELPYALNALEPHISEAVMNYHYNKHHLAYETKFNETVEAAAITDSNLEHIVKNYLKYGKDHQINIRQFGGGLINHNFFFEHLLKGKPLTEGMEIKAAIESSFGSFEEFQKKFEKFAMGVFGSGWTWLTLNNKGELRIYNTYNQDTPWFIGMVPVLSIDVWEHAYYLDYKNDRKKYIENFWHVVNWDVIEENFKKAKHHLKTV